MEEIECKAATIGKLEYEEIPRIDEQGLVILSNIAKDNLIGINSIIPVSLIKEYFSDRTIIQFLTDWYNIHHYKVYRTIHEGESNIDTLFDSYKAFMNSGREREIGPLFKEYARMRQKIIISIFRKEGLKIDIPIMDFFADTTTADIIEDLAKRYKGYQFLFIYGNMIYISPHASGLSKLEIKSDTIYTEKKKCYISFNKIVTRYNFFVVRERIENYPRVRQSVKGALNAMDHWVRNNISHINPKESWTEITRKLADDFLKIYPYPKDL